MNTGQIFLKHFRLGLALMISAPHLHAVEVVQPRCEYEANPVGIDALRPQLSWKLTSNERGELQKAYQIIVASTPAQLINNKGDLWDSGKVSSGESAHVPYAGSRLVSRQQCFWKVRVWGQADIPSDWSPLASWTMGLLEPADWTANWITASRWYTPPALRPPGLVAALGGWADVDLGAEMPIDSIRLYFSDPVTSPRRFQVLGAEELQFLKPRVLVDESKSDYRPATGGWQTFGLQGAKARHIRLWIIDPNEKRRAQSRLVQDGPSDPPEQFTVRQMEVISGGRNVALQRPTREMGTQWNSGHAVCLVDGMPSAGEGDQAPVDACPTPTAPLLRKAFEVSRKVRRATLYVAALGMADVSVNGAQVSEDVLGPPFTDYTRRTVYLTRDVTRLLVAGENVIGVTLGNGFFSPPGRGFGERHAGDGPPRVLIQTEIEFVDGTRQTINTDASWKWRRSAIVYNDIFTQYVEDRKGLAPGWNLPGFDDSAWRTVAITSSLGGRLVAPMGPPIRVVGELTPDRVEGNHAYFKTLSAGWPQVKVNGKAGQKVTVIGHAPAYDAPPLTFVLGADGPAVLQPSFMYLSGPLDLEVLGLTAPLDASSVKILLVHADLEPAGTFAASNPWLNELHEVDLRTHLNYDGDQPMDPMREKEGWTQDAQNMFETAAYLTDVAGFYRKWWHDFADGQDESGYLSSVLPLVARQEYGWNSPWWSGVVVLLPWQHYQFYGDRRMLSESYEAMRRYVDFLGRLTASGSTRSWDDYPYLNTGDPNSPEAKEGILSWLGAGDWQNPFGNRLVVPAPLMDMPAWSYYANIVSQTAALLGNGKDAAKYAAIAVAVKDRLNRKYLNPLNGLYNNQPDCQTTQVLPLALGLVPPEQRALTHQRLIEAIHGRKDHHGTGFVGLPWLLHVLTESRETALANKIVNQPDFPGWKTLMHNGVFAEGWDGSNAQMPSCGGAIGLWLYQSVLGIIPDPTGPGFKRFIVAPQPDPASGLTWARGSYESVHGTIASDWKVADGRFSLNVAIPPNTTSTVCIPTADENSVTESGKPVGRAPNVTYLRMENGTAVFAVGSGHYSFTAKMEVQK